MDAVNWPTQARKELIDQYLMCKALTQTFNCSDKRFGNGGSGEWGEWGGGERDEGGGGVSTILAGRAPQMSTYSRLSGC